MNTMELGIEYHEEDWEHGLRCAECNRLIQEGDRYSERLEGLIDDVALVVIVCVPCALKEQHE